MLGPDHWWMIRAFSLLQFGPSPLLPTFLASLAGFFHNLSILRLVQMMERTPDVPAEYFFQPAHWVIALNGFFLLSSAPTETGCVIG
jgi:hypothetical protein